MYVNASFRFRFVCKVVSGKGRAVKGLVGVYLLFLEVELVLGVIMVKSILREEVFFVGV